MGQSHVAQIHTNEVFLNTIARGLTKILTITDCDEIINWEMKRVWMFCLINDVLCDLCGLPKIYQMYIYCIHLFMPLFIILSQSIIGKILPNLWQRRLEKPLIFYIYFTWLNILQSILILSIHIHDSFVPPFEIEGFSSFTVQCVHPVNLLAVYIWRY